VLLRLRRCDGEIAGGLLIGSESDGGVGSEGVAITGLVALLLADERGVPFRRLP
jgi:hypothetical protein